MPNVILSTAIGKVDIRKRADGWEVTEWERPTGLSWKSMRRVSRETYATYADAKYVGHITYRDLLARTKVWSMEEYQNDN